MWLSVWASYSLRDAQHKGHSLQQLLLLPAYHISCKDCATLQQTAAPALTLADSSRFAHAPGLHRLNADENSVHMSSCTKSKNANTDTFTLQCHSHNACMFAAGVGPCLWGCAESQRTVQGIPKQREALCSKLCSDLHAPCTHVSSCKLRASEPVVLPHSSTTSSLCNNYQ